jgi:hypothetical protein
VLTANAERRRKIANDMAWSSGYAAGRAAERGRVAALRKAAKVDEMEFALRRIKEQNARLIASRTEVAENGR